MDAAELFTKLKLLEEGGTSIVELRQTAVHEAGHVVVAYALGLECKEVALTHDEVKKSGSYGYAIGPNPQFGYEHESRHDQNSTMRDECIACCAGLAAEHVICGIPLVIDNENAQGDFGNIVELESRGMRIIGKSNGFVGDDATWRFIKRQLAKARALVKRHRSEIEQLADLLVKKKKLSKKEVEKFLCQSRGE